jgi:hypothetical protein
VKFLIDLLRSPQAALDACANVDQQRQIAVTSLWVIALGGVLFGAAVGSFRGFPQFGIAALKLPVVTLLTLAAAGPAFHGIASAVDRRLSFRTTLAIVLCAGARSSLVLIAIAPLLALAVDFGAAYPLVRLAALLSYGLAGLSALAFVLRAFGPGTGRLLGTFSFVLTFLVIGAQTAWLCRPYLGSPRDASVPLFAHGRIEGGLLGALTRSGAP